MKVTPTEDGGLHVGPTLDSLEDHEGFFVEKTEAPVAEEVKTEVKVEEEVKLLAGKFKTPEDLEKAYQELQKKLGAPKPKEGEQETQAQEETSSDQPKEEEGAEPKEVEEQPKEETKEDAQAPVLDFAKLTEEWEANEGKLTEETQAGLSKIGVTPEITELFYAGISSIISSRTNEIISAAGGQDEFKSLVDWGAANLPEAERKAFDAALDKAVYEGDASAINIMVAGVKARMAGETPNYVSTDNKVVEGSVKPFATRAEQNAAIQDPRYGRDRAYTTEVENRMVISSV